MKVSWTGNCSTKVADYFGLEEVAYFNATGTTNFTVKDLTGNDQPWFHHVGVVDCLNRSSTRYLFRWLSIPESFVESDIANKTALCTRIFEGQNKTMENMTGSDTCKGVLSEKCIKSSLEVKDFPRAGCPAVHRRCNGMDLFSAYQPGLSRQSACFATNISGLQVPEGYVSLRLPLLSFGQWDIESAMYYDQALKQSFASIFSFLTTDKGADKTTTVKLADGKAVCAMLKNVQEDSRPVQPSGAPVDSVPAFVATMTAVLVVFASVL